MLREFVNVLGEVPFCNEKVKWHCVRWQSKGWCSNGIGLGQKIQTGSVGGHCPEDVFERSVTLYRRQVISAAVSIHFENVTGRSKTTTRTKTLLRYDHSKWRNRLRWPERIVYVSVWLGIYYRFDRIFQHLSLFFPSPSVHLILRSIPFPELLSVSQSDEYEKESWQLNETEKSIAIENLRQKGNQLYKEKNFDEAEKSYRNALGMVEQLILKWVSLFYSMRLTHSTQTEFDREKPNDEEWLDLIKVKIPILLNYAQCRLLDKDYYAVIEHCTEVLKHEPSK